MIPCEQFFAALKSEGVEYFAGVPDSLLKDICAYIADHALPEQHCITANEGAAIALVAGRNLATGQIGLVYLQNSGLGSVVNPLMSLTAPEVYAIPMILLIGWRGEPGVPDEPQHQKQGKVTPALLNALEVPFFVLPYDTAAAVDLVCNAMVQTRKSSSPVAILVRKQTFEPYMPPGLATAHVTLRREDAIRLVLDLIADNAVVVSTTGMISREVFEYRELTEMGHHRDFLTVGCMGYASQIALGVAASRIQREVYCLDGDGSVVMHMGGLPIIGTAGLMNYKHIVLNNGAHDSVGGQPTVGFLVDIPAIASACRYRWVGVATTPDDIRTSMRALQATPGPALLEIRVQTGSRPDLGRPTISTHVNKAEFMMNIQRPL